MSKRVAKVANRWFEIERIDPALSLITEPHLSVAVQRNVWHVRGRSRDLLVDSGSGLSSLRAGCGHLFRSPVTTIATHAHREQIGGHPEFNACWAHKMDVSESAELNVTLLHAAPEFVVPSNKSTPADVGAFITAALPLAGIDSSAWPQTSVKVSRTLEEGDVVDLGDRAFEVLHLPGYTPGSIGLWDRESGVLFSGAALYEDLCTQNRASRVMDHWLRTLLRLKELPVSVVYPGRHSAFSRPAMVARIDTILMRLNA
ncbi:MBL fold metallo-hydrolase [Pseudomonas sp. 02C 26]|uniref:MBL fold metallo-hydrolase n=1 Tax=Pseudomonas sp. 02C 26 TaxID=2054914 RepID=UPI0012FEC513|nr:MBL fold metallo-hydrolase [Pseudomonas sp. 02C 26]